MAIHGVCAKYPQMILMSLHLQTRSRIGKLTSQNYQCLLAPQTLDWSINLTQSLHQSSSFDAVEAQDTSCVRFQTVVPASTRHLVWGCSREVVGCGVFIYVTNLRKDRRDKVAGGCQSCWARWVLVHNFTFGKGLCVRCGALQSLRWKKESWPLLLFLNSPLDADEDLTHAKGRQNTWKDTLPGLPVLASSSYCRLSSSVWISQVCVP